LRFDVTDFGRPSTWIKYRSGLCHGCEATCCSLPVEASASDLVRMGLADETEVQGSLRKLGNKLISRGFVRYFRDRTGLFLLAQKSNGECLFLGADKRCTIYDRRPEVCRNFPATGPRPGYCPMKRLSSTKSGALPLRESCGKLTK